MHEYMVYISSLLVGIGVGSGFAYQSWASKARRIVTLGLDVLVLALVGVYFWLGARAMMAGPIFALAVSLGWACSSSFITRNFPVFEGIGFLRRMMMCVANFRTLRLNASSSSAASTDGLPDSGGQSSSSRS